ncbi:AAA family ATPase [Leptolyngbya sp. NIES-2104]|uniref:AAA family ATPase n=1 Tax=Leptolyngbya sp. NIES-2104 TaxID=1552121 RepID=UPI0006EC7860|nr:AAA family ATPase [Leptolyngbya sp. NIES-2104]GAP98386.1 hypothetical protein NIES2104_49410 [Leptolyngbya sp. NIES-2104]
MFKALKIENFRGFKAFELQQLDRVNLLVGRNNSGKTSILEAIQLLCSRANLEPLIGIMTNRGEYSSSENHSLNRQLTESQNLDIQHLFYGHTVQSASHISISGSHTEDCETLTVSLDGTYGDFDSQLEEPNASGFSLLVQWKLEPDTEEVQSENLSRLDTELNLFYSPLSANFGLSTNRVRSPQRKPYDIPINIPAPINTQFITPFSLSAQSMIEMFEDFVVLTPEEQVVNQALHTIESRIERIAPISSKKSTIFGSRTGFIVKLTGINERVPIGSMGDGIWRMLGLAISAVGAKGGVLLVDEIDTGLHFTVMVDMWKMILQIAQRLDIQVFATTHSRDCWESLAEAGRLEESENEITIHRIERERDRSVIFSGRKMMIAADQEIEVR